MGADAEADEGLLAQAKDNDKISGYLGRWKAYLPLSTDGIILLRSLGGAAAPSVRLSPEELPVKIEMPSAVVISSVTGICEPEGVQPPMGEQPAPSGTNSTLVRKNRQQGAFPGRCPLPEENTGKIQGCHHGKKTEEPIFFFDLRRNP